MTTTEDASDAPAAIAAASAATNEVVIDALPYIDHGYDEPGVREAVGNGRCHDFNLLLGV